MRQQRQKTGMVDMGMGDEHKVDLAGGYGQGLVFVHIFALLHAVVDEERCPAASSMVQLPVTSWFAPKNVSFNAKHLRFVLWF